jgi:hypothetical protein
MAPLINTQRTVLSNEEILWNMSEHMADTEGCDDYDEEELNENGCECPTWNGDDMSIKTDSTGARIATLNTQRKFFAQDSNREAILSLMKELQIDVLALTEPGKADATRVAALKNWAISEQMAAEVITRSDDSLYGGIVLLISQAWRGAKRTVHTFKPEKAERDRVFGIEFDNLEEGAHNKLLVIGYYGKRQFAKCQLRKSGGGRPALSWRKGIPPKGARNHRRKARGMELTLRRKARGTTPKGHRTHQTP